MIPSIDGFVGVYKNFFDKELCEQVIKEFERVDELGFTHSRQQIGHAAHTKDDQSYWTGEQDHILRETDTRALDGMIGTRFSQRFWNEAFPHYRQQFSLLDNMNLACWGSKVQRTKVGGGYHIWHCENDARMVHNRVAPWILYLNDVEEGGETELLYQHKRYKPEQGTLIIFPACYAFAHRGNPPLSNTKYIMTGWVEYCDQP